MFEDLTEVHLMEGADVGRWLFWTLLVFVVPLTVIVVSWTMGPVALFWGLLLGITVFGVFLPLSLDIGGR